MNLPFQKFSNSQKSNLVISCFQRLRMVVTLQFFMCNGELMEGLFKKTVSRNENSTFRGVRKIVKSDY